jgi:hypothetical protein
MNIRELHVLALGRDEADMVDTAIPQALMDSLSIAERANVAGWYYAPECKIFGRLLKVSECWEIIRTRLENGELRVWMAGTDITPYARTWPCLRIHEQKGELTIEVAK